MWRAGGVGEKRTDRGQGSGCSHPTAQQVPPGLTQTHFAESVLMEPVTSMSPARNNWYLVQAIVVDTGEHLNQQIQPGSPGMWRLLTQELPGRESHDPTGPRPTPASPAPELPPVCGRGAGEAECRVPVGHQIFFSFPLLGFFFFFALLVSHAC